MSEDKFGKTLLKQMIAGIAVLLIIIGFYACLFSWTHVQPLWPSHKYLSDNDHKTTQIHQN